STEPGLRERKKRQTRQSIADTARALFAERGFDRVTVAEVARAANVSEATVFNYFPTKEDLVFSGLEAFEAALVGAVRDRAPWVVANALIGVHRALLDYARRQVPAGRSGPGLARAVRARADRAIAALEHGFADLGMR